MAHKLWILMLAFVVLIACTGGVLGQSGEDEVDAGAEELYSYGYEPKERRYTFTFWRQFLLETTANPSMYTVVQPVGPNRFGMIDCFDAGVTYDKDPESTVVGRARGCTVNDDLEKPGRENLWTVELYDLTNTTGYNFSTIIFRGYKPSQEIGEYAVVGGTGLYRGARGTIIEKLPIYNPGNTTVTSECSVDFFVPKRTIFV